MRSLREWMHRLFGTLRPTRRDDDLAEELRLHAELAAERGRRVTGASQAMDALRDQRGLPWIEDFARDVRHAFRSLRRAPGFTAVALLTLALGIGVNSAMFTIVNAVMLKPLGYFRAEQLMFLSTHSSRGGLGLVSPPEYLEFRELNRSFSAVGAYRTAELNLASGDRPVRVRAAYIDEHLLNALGARAEHGRLFNPGETDVSGPAPGSGQQPRRRAVGILSYELWRSAFGGRPMVGEAIEVNGVRGEVIGIMSPGVDVLDHGVQVWLPLGLNPANRQNRGSHTLYLIGQLKDGVTADAAQAELDALMQNWAERVGITPGPGAAGHRFEPLNEVTGGHILAMTPLREAVVGNADRTIWALQLAVGLVLVIACANLASLLLARAATRQREFVIRQSLGAGRRRLVRQLVTEGVVLSVAGAAIGLLPSYVLVRAVIRVYPDTLPRTSDITLEPSVVVFTLGVAITCGVLFGLAPLVHTRLTQLVTSLKESASNATRPARTYFRQALVAIEIALAVMLVIGGALLTRTVYNLMQVDAGFDRSRLVTFSMTLPPAKYPQVATRQQMYQRVLDQLRAVAGVDTVTAMSGLPPLRSADANDTDIEGYEERPGGPAESVDYYQYVMAGYFETMGIPIVAGRSFESSDTASSGRVAVVNETLAKMFWPDRDPIGRRLRRCPCGDQIPWYTVIGVARDVRQGGIDRSVGSEMYFFAEQLSPALPQTMNIAIRTELSPAALFPTIDRVVREVDPAVPIVGLREMNDVYADTVRRPRLIAQLFGAFAGLALLLAVTGTYGLLSYLVAQRRREIGVRLALGATRHRVVALVMQQGLVLAAVGLAFGIAGALGLTQLIESLLFGVESNDGATIAGVVAVVTIVAVVACWIPAFRASRLDPVAVLRAE